MNQLKPCDICGNKIAKFVCKKCGANVCENCYDKEKGICSRCLLH